MENSFNRSRVGAALRLPTAFQLPPSLTDQRSPYAAGRQHGTRQGTQGYYSLGIPEQQFSVISLALQTLVFHLICL